MKNVKIKIGDKLQIHCYKHDGTLYRTCDEATVLEIKDNYMVCANYKTKIIEKLKNGKMKRYSTKEPAILFLYKDSWFNIIAQIKASGLYYYCNMASPYIIDDGIIKYIDYDLDLRVYPDGAHRVLDKNEYAENRVEMNYPDEIDKILNSELERLIEMKKWGLNPFDEKVINHYNDLYKKVKNQWYK